MAWTAQTPNKKLLRYEGLESPDLPGFLLYHVRFCDINEEIENQL